MKWNKCIWMLDPYACRSLDKVTGNKQHLCFHLFIIINFNIYIKSRSGCKEAAIWRHHVCEGFVNHPDIKVGIRKMPDKVEDQKM